MRASLSVYVSVALRGAIGACARYLAGGLVHRVAPFSFPWGTFAVNVVGCFAFGLRAGVAEQRDVLGPAAPG